MRFAALIFVVLIMSLSLAGCGGSSTKSAEPEKAETGSLMRSFKLIDDQGRESGTLVLNPLGGAELRDANGKVIGSFAPSGAAPQMKEPAEEKTDPDEEKKQ